LNISTLCANRSFHSNLASLISTPHGTLALDMEVTHSSSVISRLSPSDEVDLNELYDIRHEVGRTFDVKIRIASLCQTFDLQVVDKQACFWHLIDQLVFHLHLRLPASPLNM